MIATNIIGIVVFAVSFGISLFLLIGTFFKNVGVNCLGTVSSLFFLAFPMFCFAFEQAMFFWAPYAWGVSIIFILLNLYFVVIEYFCMVGSVIAGKKHLYKFGYTLMPRRYSYDDVIGFTMKYSSGNVLSRFGRSRVKTYDMELHFADQTRAEFSVKAEDDKKVSYFKEMLVSHHCRRDGRCRKQKRR